MLGVGGGVITVESTIEFDRQQTQKPLVEDTLDINRAVWVSN